MKINHRVTTAVGLMALGALSVACWTAIDQGPLPTSATKYGSTCVYPPQQAATCISPDGKWKNCTTKKDGTQNLPIFSAPPGAPDGTPCTNTGTTVPIPSYKVVKSGNCAPIAEEVPIDVPVGP